MKLRPIFLIITMLPLAAPAQELKPLAISPDQAVTNDDLGKAFIIERNLKSLSSFGRWRKGTISEPQQFSIFLGRGWASPTLAERKLKLSSLLVGVTNHDELIALQELGIRNRFGPTASAQRLGINPGKFADLEVQRTIAAMLNDGTMPRPTPKTIFVVFLDASLHSTLGGLIARKHYAAYHSAFNHAGLRIRYVVVPFDSNPLAATRIALRAFVAAAIKPGQTAAK